MASMITIHPENPQSRQIDRVVTALRQGAIVLYPTDTVYAIGCDLNAKSAIEQVRRIKQLSNDKPLTFLCPSLSNIATYALVSDTAYRIMKRLVPGPYTFILPTTKLVPKLVMNAKRRTTGIRVPENPICQAILAALDHPIISTSAHLLSEEEAELVTGHKRDVCPLPTVLDQERIPKAELFDCLHNIVDVIVDDQLEPGYQVSTILDLTLEEPVLIRRGSGWAAVEDWLAPQLAQAID